MNNTDTTTQTEDLEEYYKVRGALETYMITDDKIHARYCLSRCQHYILTVPGDLLASDKLERVLEKIMHYMHEVNTGKATDKEITDKEIIYQEVRTIVGDECNIEKMNLMLALFIGLMGSLGKDPIPAIIDIANGWRKRRYNE
jgi:hypothetical protein